MEILRNARKVYIAGKTTGDCEPRRIAEQFSHEERQRRSFGYREKFERARAELELAGHVVLNPASLPEGMSTADYMRICSWPTKECQRARHGRGQSRIIDVADTVALLPGWRESHGAQLERKYCAYIRKLVVEL